MTDDVYYGGEVEKDEEGRTVHYAPAKDFWRWFDDFTKPWEPTITELSEHFGTTFSMNHTGGGCMALEAKFENGFGVMVTDAEDVLGRYEDRSGYAVGVYPITPCDCWLPPGVQIINNKPVCVSWEWPNGHNGRSVRLETPYNEPLPDRCEHSAEMNTCDETAGWASSPEAISTAQLIKLIRLALDSVGRESEPFRHVDPALLRD